MMKYSVPREEYDQLKDALEKIRQLAIEGRTFNGTVSLHVYLDFILEVADKGLAPFGQAESHDNMGF